MRKLLLIPAVAAAASMALAETAFARHNADVHTDNMSLVGSFTDDGKYFQGSDLAFWGNTAVAGNYATGFRLIDISNPTAPREIGESQCPGAQNDVSLWKDLVFVSIDAPRSSPACDAPVAPASEQQAGTDWEGIRVFSIANPASPQQIAAVRTDCGSHTHTLIPDEANNRVLLYVLSYPLGAQTTTCNAERHRKISVVEVPLGAPQDAKVVSQPKITNPAIGCHDVTVFLERKLAAAACIDYTALWDISDPVNPRVVTQIADNSSTIHHTAAFSWSGRTLVIGDEFAGAAAPQSCALGGAPLGALWFYDITNPSTPARRGYYAIQSPDAGPELCTAHNFNVVPLRNGKDILVVAWYEAAATVLDFTTPTAPQLIGRYDPKTSPGPLVWSAYWYNGKIYANNFGSATAPSRGIDVMQINHPDLAAEIPLPRLNPQTQEPLPAAPAAGGAGGAAAGTGQAVTAREVPGRFLISRRARRLRAGGTVRVTVSCRAVRPCRGALRLRTAVRSARGAGTRNVRIGARSFSVPARRRAVLPVRLSQRGRRLLAEQRRMRVLVIANVRALRSPSRTGTVTASFRLVRPEVNGRGR